MIWVGQMNVASNVSPLVRSDAWSVEVKDLSVGLHWIVLRLPSRQSVFEKLNPGKMHAESSMQNCSPGFLATTGAVNDSLFVLRDQ